MNNIPQKNYFSRSVPDVLPLLFQLTIVATLVIFPVRDYDTFWHVANGRAMIETGQIVSREIFSYTAQGTPFNNHAWLAQILMFLAYDRWGASGLIGFKVVLTLAIGATLYVTSRLLGARPWTSALLCLFVMIAALSRFTVRPQLFSLLGVALLGLLLFGYRSGRWGKKSLLWLPPLMLLWDVLHGAIYGLMLLGPFVLGESLKYLLRFRLQQWPAMAPLPLDRLRALWVWTGTALLLMLLSPYGLLSYDVFLNLVSGKTEAAFVGEFLPTPWRGFQAFWALLAMVALLFLQARRSIDLTELFILIPFAWLGIRYTRGVGAFSIAALPFLAACTSRLALSAIGRRLGSNGRNLTVALAMAGCLLYTGYLKFAPHPDTADPAYGYRFGGGIDGNFLPVASVRFIQAAGLTGNMYNTDRYGGYLAYFAAPERKIFHYNHPSIFRHLYDFVHNPAARAQWQISYALIAREDELQMFTRDGFVPVYWEPTAMVLINPSGPDRELIERYRIRFFQPLLPEKRLLELGAAPGILPVLAREMATYLTYRRDPRIAGVFAELLRRPDPSLPVGERLELLRQAEQQNADVPPLLVTAGLLLHSQHRLAEARASLRTALHLDRQQTEARINLAYVEFDLGNFREAAAEFQQVLDEAPDHPEALYGLGLSQLRLAQYASAKANFATYLRLVPSGPWADKARGFIADMP